MYKKIKITETVVLIILTFISHFMYDIFPNNFIASFFPINESIWEHMKLFVTPGVIVFIFEYIYMKKNKICIQNNYLALLIELMSSIGIFLTIFLPFYFKFGHNLIITILMMIFAIIISKYLGYLIVIEKNDLLLNIIAIPIITIILILNIIFTFNPPNNLLFIDSTKNEAIFYHETA